MTVPTGAFVARQNGGVFVTGNSQGFPKSLNVAKAIDKMLGSASEDAKKWEGWGTQLKPAWEPILVFRKPGGGAYDGPRPDAPFFYSAKVAVSEATKNGELENTHPTRKPLALMRWLVRLVARPGQVVIDPYCGSGTTCVAAIEEDLRFVGIERHPPFYRIAEKRTSLYLRDKEKRDALRAGFDLMADLPQED